MKNQAIVTAAQMKRIEQAANEAGLLYIQMMENAGRTAWAELARRFPAPGRLLVVAGRGNNGGDGFVMARVAAKAGWQVCVWLAEGEPRTPDACTNRALLEELPVTVLGPRRAACTRRLGCGGGCPLRHRIPRGAAPGGTAGLRPAQPQPAGGGRFCWRWICPAGWLLTPAKRRREPSGPT